ncbi:MAG: TonB family protein [Maribacter sp.]|uniref:TonB family protein n=1 Tax=Maribacter sp. TaxID=1897614 RepID=UPI0032984BA8
MKTNLPEAFQAYPEFLWNRNDMAISPSAVPQTTLSISWEYLLLFGGMFLATLLFGYKLYQIYRLKLKGEVRYFKDFTRVIVSNSSMAFSFFKSIFLGDKIVEKGYKSILQHELVHIRQRHSYDLMFFEVMRIVGWFNPLVYVYQSRVAELHEFIADAQVAKTNKKEQYQLLLSEVFQTHKISFINQFLKTSLIKKRIVMLTKEKSKKVFRLKYALLLPMLIGILFYTSCEVITGDSDGVIQVQNIENLTQQEEVKIFRQLKNRSESSEDWVLFVRDKNSTMKFVRSENGSYLSGPNGEKIYAKLAIDSKLGESEMDLFTAFLGKDTEVSVERESSVELYNRLAKERQRLLEIRDERDPIIVKLETQLKDLEEAMLQVNQTVTFANVDEVPVFPGCGDADDKRKCFNEKMHRHISKHFNYPKEAQEKGVQGNVSIMLTIDMEGHVTTIRTRGPDKLLENEAERIMKRLPKMVPGKEKGIAVNVPYSIPITFKLQDEVKDADIIKLGLNGDLDPVYMVDGKESTKEKVAMLNSNDIESMSVLKGEAAKNVYGKKGKNGVVQITTKKKE